MKVTNIKADQLKSKSRLISGRQVLWHIYRHLRTNANQDQIYGVFDIAQIRWFGDKYKAKFLSFWDEKMSQVQGKIDAWMKAEILFRALVKSNDLKIEMLAYQKKYLADLGQRKGDKRYEALKDILYRTVAREREEANRNEREAHDRKEWERLVPSHPTAPAPTKGKGSKSKGKGRSQSRSGKGEGNGKGKQRSQSAKGGRKGGGGKSGSGEKGLCVNFVVQGSCQKGADCGYRHERPKDSKEEQYYKDLHKRISSRSKSPAPKGKGRGVCRLWEADGSCKFGDSCRYEHVTGTAAPATKAQPRKRFHSRNRKNPTVAAPATPAKSKQTGSSGSGNNS